MQTSNDIQRIMIIYSFKLGLGKYNMDIHASFKRYFNWVFIQIRIRGESNMDIEETFKIKFSDDD